MPIVADSVHTVVCHSHFSTRLFLVRGGIPIPFMKINAASGPGLGRNRISQTGKFVINSTVWLAARVARAARRFAGR
jgi:hypothetical protein